MHVMLPTYLSSMYVLRTCIDTSNQKAILNVCGGKIEIASNRSSALLDDCGISRSGSRSAALPVSTCLVQSTVYMHLLVSFRLRSKEARQTFLSIQADSNHSPHKAREYVCRYVRGWNGLVQFSLPSFSLSTP